MEDLNIKQLTLAVRTIAEEKNLPEETVMSVIEQAIAAAWRRDNGERDQEVRAELNINDGTAEVFVAREVVETVGSDAVEISLEDAKKVKGDAEIGDTIEEKHEVTSFGDRYGAARRATGDSRGARQGNGHYPAERADSGRILQYR